MNLCIGMMYQYDDHWLKLHVPKLAKSHLPFVFLNGNGVETEIDTWLQKYGAVFYRRFEWNFADQQNHLNACAEKAGYDAIIKLDPDELMFPGDLHSVGQEIGLRYRAACLPRLNFVQDRNRVHKGDGWYPDWQTRVWELGHGVEWRGQHHASAAASIRELQWRLDQLRTPIFHYKWIASRESCTLSRLNYTLTKDGLPPLENLPDGEPLCDIPAGEPFTGKQPLDPRKIGARAPFGD